MGMVDSDLGRRGDTNHAVRARERDSDAVAIRDYLCK